MEYRLLSKYRAELMGVAMLWVMFFHAFDLDMGHPLADLVRRAGFGGVDIFILLSAMGLVLSLSRQPMEDSLFLARRARRILPSYYAVMLPYTLFLILVKDAPWSALFFNSTLLYYWVRSAGAFNWYVAGAMTFYAITPWCYRRWRSSPHPTRLTVLSVLAGFALCQLLIQENYWYVTDVFYRLPVFFLGLLMGLYVRDGRALRGRDLLFWTASLGAGLLWLWASLTLEWEGGPFLFPLCHLFLFTTVPMCLVLSLLFDRLPLGWLRRFFRLLGQNSLEIYLLNVSFFAHPELFRPFLSFDSGNRLYYLSIFTLNILLGLALHKGMQALSSRRNPSAP